MINRVSRSSNESANIINIFYIIHKKILECVVGDLRIHAFLAEPSGKADSNHSRTQAMILTFLGTGTSQGVPVITCGCEVCTSSDPRDKRLRTSAMLTTDDGLNILFDVGPDFRQQMLRERVMHIDAVLVTHAHRDHVAGIDDIRAFNYVQHRPLDFYGNDVALGTSESVEESRRLSIVAAEPDSVYAGILFRKGSYMLP